MIDTNIGNPTVMYENLISLFNNFGYDTKDIFTGEIDMDSLKYQKRYTQKYDDLIRFYYKNILKRPLTQTDYLIISQGSLGSYYSVIWAMNKLLNKNEYDKLKIFQLNKPPTYDIYSHVTQLFSETEFKIDYKKYENINYNADNCDISVMISPNNPTGEIINERKGMFQIIDSVYDIPPFTNTYTPLNTKYSDNEIYIESFSKLGVASYRLGWAVINDSMIASKAWEYNKLHNLGMITPSFYASKNLVNIFAKNENSFDIYSKISFNVLKQRRKELTNLLSKHNLYNENFTKTIYSPYIMVPMKREKFISMGIDTRDGKDFFYPNYSRINLMMGTEDYKKMIKVLETNLRVI